MKSAICVLVGVLTATIASADAVTLSSGAGAYAFSSVFNGTTQSSPAAYTSTTQLLSGDPFWDNYSTDTAAETGLCTSNCSSHDMNIGYMLSGTGGFAGDNVFGGMDSVATAYLNANGSDPSSFTFSDNPAQTYDVTLLGAFSGNSNSLAWGTQFGIYYVVGGVMMYEELYGPGANSYSDTVPIDIASIQDSGASVIGFYATVCNYDATATVGTTPEGTTTPAQCGATTYYSNSLLNTGFIVNNESSYYDGGAYNHFSLFGLTSSPNNDFVVAFKDGPLTTEGLGDFNDVVVEFADPSFQTPEPASLGIAGLGLVLLGIKRRRLHRS
jgi:PEP-CTERM motif